MSEEKIKISDQEPALENIFKVIGGKWKIQLVKIIMNQCPKRFGELRRELEDLAQTTLTTQLKDLERDGIISRLAFAESPPRVEYKLTPLGETLIPLIESMECWWKTYSKHKTGAKEN